MTVQAGDLVARYAAAGDPATRCEAQGAEVLTDEELFGLVVVGKPPAGLLAEIGGPSALRQLGTEDFRKLGVRRRESVRLRAALELGRRALLPRPLLGLVVRCAADVAEQLRVEFAHGEQESLHAFGLDARNRICCRQQVVIGGVDRLQVNLADVFRPLLRRAVATFLVVHNHPSGEPSPSPDDEELTRRLEEMGLSLGIPLLDHIIVAASGHFSFDESGMLLPRRRGG